MGVRNMKWYRQQNSVRYRHVMSCVAFQMKGPSKSKNIAQGNMGLSRHKSGTERKYLTLNLNATLSSIVFFFIQSWDIFVWNLTWKVNYRRRWIKRLLFSQSVCTLSDRTSWQPLKHLWWKGRLPGRWASTAWCKCPVNQATRSWRCTQQNFLWAAVSIPYVRLPQTTC